MIRELTMPPAAACLDAEDALRLYAPMVYRLAYVNCNNKSDAGDVLQEVFLRLVERDKPFDSAEHQKAWLIRVTINCAHKLYRSSWTQKTQPLSDLEESPVFDPEPSAVLEAVQRLPERYRAVVHLFYYENYKAAEIGRLLGRNESTVKTQLSRGRTMLKDALKGAFDDE